PYNVGPVGTNGGIAANRLAREADLGIALGKRPSGFTTAPKTVFQDPDVTIVRIKVNAVDAATLPSIALGAGAREAMEALTDALERAEHVGTPPAYRDRIETLQAEWRREVDAQRARIGQPGDLLQPGVVGVINDEVGGSAVVINAAGSLPGDLLKL